MASHLIRLISSWDIPCLRPRRITKTRITLSATSNTLKDSLLRPMILSSQANCLYVQRCYSPDIASFVPKTDDRSAAVAKPSRRCSVGPAAGLRHSRASERRGRLAFGDTADYQSALLGSSRPGCA